MSPFCASSMKRLCRSPSSAWLSVPSGACADGVQTACGRSVTCRCACAHTALPHAAPTTTIVARIVLSFMVEPLDQALELFDLVAAQALPLRELRNEGRYAAAKEPVDEVAALLVDEVVARDQRSVEIAAAVGLCG